VVHADFGDHGDFAIEIATEDFHCHVVEW